MKKILLIYFFILMSESSLALIIRTVSQDNSAIKYNLNNEKLPGLCREVISAVEKEIPGLKFSGLEKAVPIQRIEQFLERNEIDVFFCLLKTDEREKKFSFIETPIYSIRHAILMSVDDPLAQKKSLKLSDFKNEGTIFVNKGSSLIDDLKKEGVKFSDGGKSDSQIIDLLEASRGRFFYGQDLTLKFMLGNHAKKNRYKIVYLEEKFKAQQVAYSKSLDPKIVKQLTFAIKKLSDSGVFEKLYKKYASAQVHNQKLTFALK